jgi:hypothetical protein
MHIATHAHRSVAWQELFVAALGAAVQLGTSVLEVLVRKVPAKPAAFMQRIHKTTALGRLARSSHRTPAAQRGLGAVQHVRMHPRLVCAVRSSGQLRLSSPPHHTSHQGTHGNHWHAHLGNIW